MKLKFAILTTIILGVAVGELLYLVGNVTLRAETRGSLVSINGEEGSISLYLEDSDNDGFSDSTSFVVRNEGDFSFTGRIANLAVRHGSESYLVILMGNGIWYFYSDVDSSGNVSAPDIKIGKVKIEQGSSALEGDSFTVASNGEKVLGVKLYFEPYAPSGSYEVSFDVIAIYETANFKS
jgi:hypothetical protein